MDITLTLALPRDRLSVPVVRRILSDSLATLGLDEETVGILPAIEPVESATFRLPTATDVGDFTSGRLLRDAARLSSEVGEREAAVDLYIIVEYGVKIPDIALHVQENVKRAVESMTGLDVIEINVHVQGVGFSPENKEEDIRVR